MNLSDDEIKILRSALAGYISDFETESTDMVEYWNDVRILLARVDSEHVTRGIITQLKKAYHDKER